MAPMGRVILIGLVAGTAGAVDFGRVLRARLTVRGTVMRARALEERIVVARRFAAEVVPLLAAGTVRPTVERVFPLAQIAEAHRLLESNATVGKVVLSIA
jgi:NADPH:quinone reductase-like Zn-dependent oxidoreductase